MHAAAKPDCFDFKSFISVIIHRGRLLLPAMTKRCRAAEC